MMIPLTLDSLSTNLQQLSYDVKFQEVTHQLYIIFNESGREYPLFIKVENEGKALQLIIFLPCQLQTQQPGDMARLLHLLNKEIDYPGFGMDENIGVIFYRIVLTTSDGMLDKKVLEQMMAALPKVSNMFYPVISAVARGATFVEASERLKNALQNFVGK